MAKVRPASVTRFSIPFLPSVSPVTLAASVASVNKLIGLDTTWKPFWVFDDPAVGLSREPFVAGIDTMIDRLVASIPGAEGGFRLVFSAAPFPGHTVKLEWRRAESGGNWYYCPQFDIEGWLCPALFKYFDKAPAELYGRAEAKR